MNFMPTVPRIDQQLALSTLLGIGAYWVMNKLSSIDLNPTDKAFFSWGMPIAVLVNQIWRQTLVSRLPDAQNNALLKATVSPWTFLTAFAFELPWAFIQIPFTPKKAAPPYSL